MKRLGRRTHYLTVNELAERWTISVPAAYRVVERGDVKSIRFGNSIRLPVVEVEKYERQRLGYSVESADGVA